MVTTTFANLPDGFQFLSLFDQAFAQCAQLQNPIIVSTSGGTFTAPPSGGDILIIGSGANSVQLRQTMGSGNNQPQSVVDIAGNAASHNITILTFGSEEIMGQSSIVIATNYGGLTFWPIPTVAVDT